jgi:hypothetical protein
VAATTQVALTAECPELQDGLQARIHDPLWLLARQWQFGEFRGEDTGSPAGAHLVMETAPITRYRPGPQSGATGVQPYIAAALALETLVEREAVVEPNAPSWRWAAEAGQQLNRFLDLEGAAASRAVFLRSPYALVLPPPQARRALDNDSRRFLSVVGGRVVDGTRFRERAASLRDRNAMADLFQERPFDTVPAADQPKVVRAIAAWLAWYSAAFSDARGSSAWVSERIEYEFAVSGKTSDGEVVLAAPEYLEGHLDWFSFVARPGASLGATDNPTTNSAAFLPAPVSYRGMPSPRFWEFEDANVNFAKVEGDPEDLARVLLVKFALEYGNDWFLVPVEIDVGSLCRVRSLLVTNTFGERLLVPHTTEVDGANSPWRAFALSADTRRLFFLPPVLGTELQSPPIEDVLFLRDEMANVAWAVERVVQSPAGRPLDRYEAYQDAKGRRDEDVASGGGAAADGSVAYRLGTTVPDYWIPLLPVQDGTSIRLKRGALPKLGDGVEGLLEARGRVLEPGRELLLHDEEVPREGARVSRAYQYARWTDGSTHLWIGRRKQPGRGEGSSGLQFDVVTSAAGAGPRQRV